MPVCLRSQPSCHASLKFAGYSNLINGDILKMSNLKLSQPGVEGFLSPNVYSKAVVPQISNLSPLLFFIHVNDMPNPSHDQTNNSEFADDDGRK